jgi:hypothetical protein
MMLMDGEGRPVNTDEYFIGLRMQASNHYHFPFLFLFYAFIFYGKNITHTLAVPLRMRLIWLIL